MSVLRVSLLGSVRVTRDDSGIESRLSRSTQALLAYLMLRRHRSQSREVLAGLFWGDRRDDRARSCLSAALWRLRRELEPEGVPRGTYVTTSTLGEVGFNPGSRHWLDVAELETQVTLAVANPTQALIDADARALQGTLALYTGELLEGFYDDWVLPERERLRALYLSGLARLMRHYRDSGEHERGLACGRTILEHDPLREEIHREMIRLYLVSGQRASAVRQYERCRDILEAELGIPPMEETQALYTRLEPELKRSPALAPSPEESSALDNALRQVRQSMRRIDAASRRLQEAVDFVERYADGRAARP